VLIFMITCI